MERAFIVLLALTVLAGCNSDSDEEPEHPLQSSARERVGYGKSDNASLVTVDSCESLELELKILAAAEIETFFEMLDSSQPVPVDVATGAPASGGEGDDANAADGAGDYTNNQVAGIDEADFVKTDGERLFALEGNALHRFDIPSAGTITAAGKIEIEGAPAAMLLAGDRILVMSASGHGETEPGIGAADDVFVSDDRIKATLIEWPDSGTAVVVQERFFDGGYLTAREMDATARVVLHGRLPNPVLDDLWQYANDTDDKDAAKAAALADLAALEIDALLPRSYVNNANGELITLPYTSGDCARFEVPADSNGSGVTSIVSLDMMTPDEFVTRHIVSNYPTVHVSENHLVLAESAQNWWWYWWEDNNEERLNLHAFDVTDGDVDYLGSARATGMPINQFALDEYEGVLRVATWTGGNRWWWSDAPIESQVHTFAINAGELQKLGALNGIAAGEQLFAARFLGDTAYLVTFEQIDPLFTIDLSDPANPAILGELEVPGFSTYLHPLNGGRLLSIGVGGDANGATWNTTVSLFDVSDLSAPALLMRHDLANDNNGWNWSDALYEHKAFQFHEAFGLLALPLSATRTTNDYWEWISTLELVKVENDVLSTYGSIDHSAYFSSTDYGYSPEIRRSFFIGDHIYAISSKAVTVHDRGNPAVVVADALFSAN